jgi:ABC-type transport system substrate-binding protein
VVGGLGPSATNLRQAIAIAVDMEEFVSIFRNGRGVASQGPIPPGLFGAKEGSDALNPVVYDWVDGHPQRKSLQTARELLAQAGYPNGRDAKTGKPLVLYLDTPATGPDSKPLLEWWRKQFAKLDIQLVIRDSDYNRFQDKMRQGNAQIYQWGWNADYPDPENFLSLLVGKNGKVKYQGENASNYQNAEFDRLFEQMRSMDNGSERQRVIDEMLAIVRRDGPWLWGFHPTNYTLLHQWVANAKPNSMARNTLKYLRVDASSRRQLRESWNPPLRWPLLTIIGLVLLSCIPATMAYRRRQRAQAL